MIKIRIKKKENKLKEGLIGAAIGAGAVSAAVLLADEKKREAIKGKAKEASDEIRKRSDVLRGRISKATKNIKDEVDEAKPKASSIKKKAKKI